MNWQAVSFDWNQVPAFLATAEEGSLSAAARALRSTQPTVGRQISALERSLTVTLFERAGRSLTLTAAGHDLLEHVQDMADAASRFSMAASGQSSAVEGKVSITASDVMAVGFLPDVLRKLHQIAPKIDVEIVASNRLEDLTRRSADIAIRHVRPEHPDLIAKQMRDFTAGFYASNDYVAEYGFPQKARDLEGHAFIGPRDTVQMSEMLQEQGIIIAERQYRTMTDSGVVMWEMMRAGLGIALLPGQLWPPSDEVMPVLTDLPPLQFPIWLVTHRELKTSRRIRMVFDALAEAFATTDKATP